MQRGKTVRVQRKGNVIDILRCDYTRLTIMLNDKMLNLDKTVTVRYKGKTVWRGKARRLASLMRQTLFERNDPSYMFPAMIQLKGF